MMQFDQLLLWFDLETTGLDERQDVILEVGWGISTPRLEWFIRPISYVMDLAITLDSSMIPPKVSIAGGPAEVDPYVAAMHSQSNLWKDLMTGPTIPLAEAEQAICSVLDTLPSSREDVTDDAKFTMAGSGVSQFDMRWVKYWMPDLHSRLTYYSIDMGTFERVDGMLRGGGFRPSRKSAAHRAVDDIEFSFRLAERYRDLLLVGVDFDRNNP